MSDQTSANDAGGSKLDGSDDIASGSQSDDAALATDEALLLAIAKTKDRGAFKEIFTRYAGRLKGALIKAGAPADEADEATQEAMLAVWRRAGSFDPGLAPASAWIFAIARNRRIDAVRKRKRPEPDPNDPLFRPDPPPPPDAAMAAAERDAKLREAVAELTEAQREVVRLAFFVGLSHPEIAAHTGAPLGTVKSRLRLAAERLRVALGPEFGSEFFHD